jgi:hypothetical protein
VRQAVYVLGTANAGGMELLPVKGIAVQHGAEQGVQAFELQCNALVAVAVLARVHSE